MPLNNSAVNGGKEGNVGSPPLRRSKRLNNNRSNMSTELNARCPCESEDFSQSEENKSKTTADSASETAQVQEQEKQICVAKNNDSNSEFATKILTRSQTNHTPKIIIKECFVILGNKIRDVIAEEPKINGDEISGATSDKENKKSSNNNEENKHISTKEDDKSETLEDKLSTECDIADVNEEKSLELKEAQSELTDHEQLNSGLEKNTINAPSSEENDIDFKIDDLLSRRFSTSDSEEERNPFIDSMAEEGEEDTPSEGSNDIPVVGEEINSTESEFSTDESYDNNSFIDDENDHQLLSGEEYDLSFDKPKKSRIIQLSSGSDDDIITICKPKKEPPKKRKKSRIIKFSDSSDEEIIDEVVVPSQQQDEIEETVEITDKMDASQVSTNECEQHFVRASEEMSTKIENNECGDMNHLSSSSAIVNVSIVEKIKNKSSVVSKNVVVENTSNEQLSDRINQVIDSLCSNMKNFKEISINLSDVSDSNIMDASQASANECEQDNSARVSEEIENNQCGDMNHLSASSAIVNVSVVKKIKNKSSVVSKNILMENTSNKQLSDRINQVIDSLCSSIKDVKEITINLSAGSGDVQNKIGSTKFPQSSSKKRKRIRRRINKKQLLTETAKIGEPKVKKIKLDAIKKPSNYFVPSSIKIDEPHKENHISLASAKRKRRINGAMKNVDSTATMNILDEALFDVHKKASSVNQSERWDVADVLIKPWCVSKEQVNKMEHRIINCTPNKSEDYDNIPKNIVAKDFKNLMLYDSSRIKRMNTKQVIKKRSVSANA